MPLQRELVGWLVMQKEDRTGRVVIEVYKQECSIYLMRDGSEPRLVNAGRAMRWSDEPVRFWSCKASTVWDDLEICEGMFYPPTLGYPA